MPATTAAPREKRRAASRNTARKRKNKSPGFLAAWWPLLVGIAVTPLAIHAASIMALAGPSALMTLYPWVLLVKSPAIGLATPLGENLSQLLMYIQFPLYGVLMALILRTKSMWAAVAIAVAAHFAAIVAVFLMMNSHTL